MREPNPPADGRSRQYITFSDFGVGQRHCAAHRISPETTFVLQQPQTPARQAAKPERYCFPAPPVAWCQPGRKFSCRLQFGEFQTAGRRFRYWVKNFSLKKRVTPSAFTSCSTNPYMEQGHRSSRYVRLNQGTCQQFASETTSDKAFGNVIFATSVTG